MFEFLAIILFLMLTVFLTLIVAATTVHAIIKNTLNIGKRIIARN